MDDYRGCTKCESLKSENQKLQQKCDEIDKRLAKIMRHKRKSMVLSGAIAALICGSAWVLGNYLHGRASAPPEPPKPTPCIESAEVISSDDSMRSCSEGGRLVVEHLNVADKVLVRCHCGANAPATDGGP